MFVAIPLGQPINQRLNVLSNIYQLIIDIMCRSLEAKGEPDTGAVDTRAAISQREYTRAAVSYHIINIYLFVHIRLKTIKRFGLIAFAT